MLRRVQARGDGSLVDLVGAKVVADDPPHGVDDLGAPAVIERDRHRAPRPLGGRGDGLGDRGLRALGELMKAADDPEPHTVIDERSRLAADRLLEERHERTDLLVATLPVLRGERVQRHVLDAALARRADRAADGLDARAMSRDRGQMTLLRPPAVPVHHERDMARDGHRLARTSPEAAASGMRTSDAW